MTVRQAFQRLATAAEHARRWRADALPDVRNRAEALAEAIENKDFAKMQALFSDGLKTIFNKDIAPVHPQDAFKTAFEKIGEIDAENLRKRYPRLYNCQKTTPLILAVTGGFHDGAKLLIDKGAKVFEETPHAKSGYTGALGAAIFRGDVEMIKLMMAHDSVVRELREKPAFRNYLLHAAASADNALSLQAIAACDPAFMEKARAYGTMKASDFKLGNGIRRPASQRSAGRVSAGA